jgi:FAD/FMN-containing dehydrogenase
VLRRSAPSLHAFDYMHAVGLRRVCERFGLAPPFRTEHEVVVVAECAAVEDPTDELLAAVDLVDEAAVATGAAEREALWRYRELHNEAITALGVPHKLDVSVPIAAVPAFERDVSKAVRELAPDAELILFGHLGDGNVHVNVLGPPPDDDRVDETVLRLVRRHGGSIAAEHGVGVAKVRWLELTRSPAEIDAMRAIKRALDPAGLLAPGRMLP